MKSKPIALAALILVGLIAGCGGGGSDGTGTEPAAVAAQGTVMDSNAVSGRVLGENGQPVQGALVRIQTSENKAWTGPDGAFTLAGLDPDIAVTVNAWKQDHYCTLAADVLPGVKDLRLELVRYQTGDNSNYEWIAPEGNGGCMDCHPAVTEIWLQNAHAGAAVNPRFLSMYSGTDTLGNQSPPTRYGPGTGPWAGSLVPLPPDPAQPYYGPGYQLDFPETPGNCASCHTPGAAIGSDADPTLVSGADSYGVHCDYCHKVADVYLDGRTGLPFRSSPGTGSSDVRRPHTDDPRRSQLFFGTFDDVNAPKNDAYLPLIRESRFCAPCHFGVFWDTVVYNSYGEWLESPYSDPNTGKTCQECHMPSPTIHNGAAVSNIAPGKGGVERKPEDIHAHLQLGAMDEEFLRNALTLTATSEAVGETLRVEVAITNDRTGHHVPTDSPLRHLILLVTVLDQDGLALAQTSGPVLPGWCGEGPADEGNYAGLPGRAFAKVLEELWTGVSPTGAYWNHTRTVSDNRIAAFATDTSVYEFAAPAGTVPQINVRLLYRRAFKALMEQKEWEGVPDILMAETNL